MIAKSYVLRIFEINSHQRKRVIIRLNEIWTYQYFEASSLNAKFNSTIDHDEFAIVNTCQRFYRVHLVKVNQSNDWISNLVILFQRWYREEQTTWWRFEKASLSNRVSCFWWIQNKRFDYRNEWWFCCFRSETIIDAKLSTSFAFFWFEYRACECDNELSIVNWIFREIRSETHEIKNLLCFNCLKHSFECDSKIKTKSRAKSLRHFIEIKTFVIIANSNVEKMFWLILALKVDFESISRLVKNTDFS